LKLWKSLPAAPRISVRFLFMVSFPQAVSVLAEEQQRAEGSASPGDL